MKCKDCSDACIGYCPDCYKKLIWCNEKKRTINNRYYDIDDGCRGNEV